MSEHLIQNETALRSIIGDSFPGLEEKNINYIDSFARAFIEKAAFVVMCTSDAQGRVDASPKGDHPGFVEILDEQTLLLPDRPGNKLAYGHLNILENPHVGMLFMLPQTSETLRVNGTAQLTKDPELLKRLSARGKPATLVTQISVQECFFHCGKAFIRSGLWQPDSWPEKHKVSFGEMYAARKNTDASIAKAIDDSIKVDYQENL